jgi:hypothetical protein
MPSLGRLMVSPTHPNRTTFLRRLGSKTGSEIFGVNMPTKPLTLARSGKQSRFQTGHILTAFAKSVSPHSYNVRLKSEWAWMA